MDNNFEGIIAKVPDEVWRLIFENLDLRDLATITKTSRLFKSISVVAMKFGSGWKWTVTPEEVLKCPESYATWFARVPSLCLRIEDILWSSDEDALSVEDIKTAERMIQDGQLLENFIAQKADLVKRALESYPDPKLPTVTTAASLAKMGYITSVRELSMFNIDISSIPSDNLAALCPAVTDCVWIGNVIGHTQTILANVKCRVLVLENITLDHEDTECLVETMRNSVEEVWLWPPGWMDINVFTQYDGLGKCCKVLDWGESYLETLTNWSKKLGWKFNHGGIFSRN